MFGETVRAHRRRLGLTQEELADRSGVGLRTIRDIEAGRISRPRPGTVRLLGDAFGLSGSDRDLFNMGALPAASARPDDVALARPVPAQLPADVAAFTGRAEAMRQLDSLLDDTTTVMISAVSGTAGIGKSTLAVHWAHQVADRFPDGQLYIDLRGFDPGGSVMSPDDAVRAFLDALGVSPNRVPADFDAQVALYRSLLAGRRVLVILDNARDARQIRPLLPGSSTCLTVVTSRDQLTSLVATESARPIVLDLLTAPESRQLLARRLSVERVAAEPEAVDVIIERCAYLPLALSIVAARAATRPRFPLAALAGELRESLDALNGIRSAFSCSHQALSSAAARMFRMLSLHPGPDLSVAAAGSLAGVTARQARMALTELADGHLITEHLPGRYAMHDLLRAYAMEAAHACDSEEERARATRRMVDHYLHSAHAADRLLGSARSPSCLALTPLAPDTRLETVATPEEATAWFSTEHGVLLAVLRSAADAGLNEQTWHLAWFLDTFLYRGGHWHDQITAWQVALPVVRSLGDAAAQAVAHRSLGRALIRLGLDHEARLHLWDALDLDTRADDKEGQAATHYHLTYLEERQGHPEKAIDHAEQALSLYQATENCVGEADALNAIGWQHALLGEHARTLAYCGRALPLLQRLGRRVGEAGTWHSLGYAHHHLGDPTQAIECYQQALTLLRDVGERYHEAEVLIHLGDTHHTTSHISAARETWQQALCILDELKHPDAAIVKGKLAEL
ncbi:ATP-binding protein [Nonomuraea rubra]